MSARPGAAAPRCVALLGGSFDPVHRGHVALAGLFAGLLQPDQLRVLPARPWQKSGLMTSDAQRVAMLQLAFAGLAQATIDRRELDAGAPTYTVDTLRGLRAELGDDVSLVFLMGADQLRNLDTWRDWRALFDLANLGVATRPGHDLALETLPPMVAQELSGRLATPGTVRESAHGKVCLAQTLDIAISSSEVRDAVRCGTDANRLVDPQVLDYIQQHHLYKN